MLKKFVTKNQISTLICAIILFSPWLPLLWGFSLVLGVLLPFAFAIVFLEVHVPLIALGINAILQTCAVLDVVGDIVLCNIFDLPFDSTDVIGLFISRIVLTIIGLIPTIMALYYLPSGDSSNNKSGQKKKKSSNTTYFFTPGAACFGLLFLAILCKIVVGCLRVYLLVKSLIGFSMPDDNQRRKVIRSSVFYEAIILFDFLFSSLPLTVLTLIEIILFSVPISSEGLHLASIFYIIKLAGAAGSAIINSKILFFEIYGIYQPTYLTKNPNKKNENRPLVQPINSSSSTQMATVQTTIPNYQTNEAISTQTTPTTANNAGKTTFQQKVDAARQKGDKAEVNRLREVGDVGYVQNTIRQLEKVKGDKEKVELILDEEIKKYDTIFRSRLYTAKTLKDPEEEEHVTQLAEQTSKKLRELRDQYLY